MSADHLDAMMDIMQAEAAREHPNFASVLARYMARLGFTHPASASTIIDAAKLGVKTKDASLVSAMLIPFGVEMGRQRTLKELAPNGKVPATGVLSNFIGSLGEARIIVCRDANGHESSFLADVADSDIEAINEIEDEAEMTLPEIAAPRSYTIYRATILLHPPHVGGMSGQAKAA